MNQETKVLEIFIDDIIPNRFQPRLSFDEQKINELAASIKIHGIIQPLVLRQIGDKYEIIAGERRFKAASIVGLTKVPAIILNTDDNQSAEIALVENLQRKDLTAIEEAKSFKKLLDRGYLSQDQLAEKMGVSQSSIANKLRLLNLDESIQQALLDEKISERHARSLLSLEDFNQQKQLLDKIQNERLTVKQLDEEIKKLKDGNNIEKMDIFEEPEKIEIFQEDISQPANNNESVVEETPPLIEPVGEQEEVNKEETMEDLESILLTQDNNFFNSEAQQPENSEIKEETIEIPSFEEMSVVPNLDIQPVVPQEEMLTIEQAIEKLTPDEENPESLYVSEEQNQTLEFKIDKSDFRSVEDAFSNLKEEILRAGLKIDMDTYNFDQYYQLIIKVYK